ncbi:MAG: hypothetical protein ACLQBL_38400 [Polyangiaceae bacterium]
MRAALSLQSRLLLGVFAAAVPLFAVASLPSGCVTNGTYSADGGPLYALPDGAPVQVTDGEPLVSCVFEVLNTFTCPGLTLAPPQWVTQCVDEDTCSTRVNGTSTSDGCQETTQYQNVTEITTTCAAWQATDAGLPTLDSGPLPVCAPGPVTSFTPTWHPPRTPTSSCTSTQIDSYLECLDDAATMSNPPSCAEWSGQLSSTDATCLTCLISNETDAQYGPLVLLPTETLINVAGCIALAEGKVDGSGCGGALQADEQCQFAACLPSCVTDTTSQIAAAVACEAQANTVGVDAGANGVCATYATKASCAASMELGVDGGTPAEQSCFGGGADAGSNAEFEAVALAFCGSQ